LYSNNVQNLTKLPARTVGVSLDFLLKARIFPTEILTLKFLVYVVFTIL